MTTSQGHEPPRPARALVLGVAALVFLLAFVLASFPARDSAVWRHLATGRALLDGTYTLGADPFAWTTEGRWVNHAWVYDLLLYGSYRLAGNGVVVAKALLAALLGLLMLRAGRAASAPWAAGLATALALVALGPHLDLQPALASYLLLAFTFCRLERAGQEPIPARPLVAHLPLLVGILLWANLDEWFLLGPLTVGLYALGTALSGGQAAQARGLALVFVASFAACLVNPHHVHVFALPAALRTNPLDPETAASPLASLPALVSAEPPWPLVAFVVLVLLGLLSFLGVARQKPWPRALVWAVLLGLAVYRGAGVPFFAVVAGPVLALNYQALAPASAPRRWRLLGPLLGGLALLGLVVAAWAGWLQGTAEPRGWQVVADPSLRAAALRLADWHRDGRLGPQPRGFALSVAAAHHLEWFCPQEKVFLDGRTGLFSEEVVADFLRVRQALIGEPATLPTDAARAVLVRRKVTHLLAADPSDRRLGAALRALWQAPADWDMAALDGRAALFTPPGTLAPYDWHRRAFDLEAATAPDVWPGREPYRWPWWEEILRPAADPLDRDEALADLVHFEALRPAYLERRRAVWEAGLTFGLLGQTCPLGPAADFHLPLLLTYRKPAVQASPSALDLFVFNNINAHMQRRDDGPPGSLLLAVRAARRALHAAPDDALAHLRLGLAYQRLHHHTAERAAAFPLLDQLRRLQAIVALKHAVRLRPDLLPAHEMLTALYQEMGALDLAHVHLQEQLRLSLAAAPRPGETLEQHAARTEALAEAERKLGKRVRELLNLVETQSFNLKVLGKAQLAESRGLPGRALEVLTAAKSYVDFGVQGAVLELHLLLLAGRTQEVRDFMEPAQEPVMGRFNYRWLQALLAATTGDYAHADDDLRRLTDTTTALPDLHVPKTTARNAVALLLGARLLRDASPHAAGRDEPFERAINGLVVLTRQEADMEALRGVLALETGAVAPAGAAFHRALAVWDAPDGATLLARHYLALMRQR